MNIINDPAKLRHYHLAFRQGAIGRKDAEYYIRILSEETLNYITGSGFDRRLIKPVLRIALKTMEEQEIQEEFDSIVNRILHDKKEMFILMDTFCL